MTLITISVLQLHFNNYLCLSRDAYSYNYLCLSRDTVTLYNYLGLSRDAYSYTLITISV